MPFMTAGSKPNRNSNELESKCKFLLANDEAILTYIGFLWPVYSRIRKESSLILSLYGVIWVKKTPVLSYILCSVIDFERIPFSSFINRLSLTKYLNEKFHRYELIISKSCLYLFSPKSTYTWGGTDVFSDIVY